jgi:cytochrome P450
MHFADFGQPSFYEDPYSVYEQLRAAGPIVSLLPRLWITGRHGVAESLLRDRRMGKDYMGYIRSRYDDGLAAGAAFQTFDRSLLMMNPPDHTRLRGLLMQAFNARHIEEFTQLARDTANHLVDQFVAAGNADLVDAYALKLPIIAICHLLGLDESETHLFTTSMWRLTQSFTRALEVANMSGADIDDANEATLALHEFFKEKLRQRRDNPGNDLISLLLHLEERGARMSDEEIVANIIFLFAAGHETTSNMIGNVLITLFRHPASLARVQRDESLLPACVLECLRYDSSVQIAAREVIEDFTFEGVSLRRGDTVAICLGSANRDPEKFVEPDRFLIDRPGLDARELASFGGGLHYCLGARLAMIEITVALGTLLRRLPGLELTNLDELNWHPANTLRGVESLHATWPLPC